MYVARATCSELNVRITCIPFRGPTPKEWIAATLSTQTTHIFLRHIKPPGQPHLFPRSHNKKHGVLANRTTKPVLNAKASTGLAVLARVSSSQRETSLKQATRNFLERDDLFIH